MRYSGIGVGISFAAGIGISSLLPDIPAHFVLAVAAGTAVIVVILSRWWRGILAGLLISIALLGAMREQTTRLPFDLLYPRANILHEVTGTVVSYPQLGDGYVQFVLAPDNIQGRILVTWFYKHGQHEQVLYGDRLRIVGTSRIPPRFPGFDYRGYLARQGIFATMKVDEKGQLDHLKARNSLVRDGDRLRQVLIARLDQLLPPVEASLAHGLLFGDRTAIPDDLSTAFRRTGLMHLLAVSGLHLGVFLAGIWFLLRFSGLRPAFTYPIVGLAVLFALWVIGPRVSLLRAALLFAFLGLGSLLADLGLILRRWVNPFQSLAAAGVVILALRPSALFDVGFQLSFGATAAILILYDPGFRVREWVEHIPIPLSIFVRPVRYTLFLLLTSLAAQAGTAPFLGYHFGMIYPLSLFGNIIAIPLATIALWVGLTGLFLSGTPLFVPLGKVFSATLHGLIVVVKWLATLPLAALDVPSWMGIWIGGLVLYVFLLALYLRDRSSYTLYSTSIASVSLSADSLTREEMK